MLIWGYFDHINRSEITKTWITADKIFNFMKLWIKKTKNTRLRLRFESKTHFFKEEMRFRAVIGLFNPIICYKIGLAWVFSFKFCILLYDYKIWQLLILAQIYFCHCLQGHWEKGKTSLVSFQAFIYREIKGNHAKCIFSRFS